MAKFGVLAVDSLKIEEGSLTTFQVESSSSITVDDVGPNPLQIFLSCESSGGAATLTRSRGSKVLGTATPGEGVTGDLDYPPGNIRRVFADEAPQNGDTYTVSGSGLSSIQLIAYIRWR